MPGGWFPSLLQKWGYLSLSEVSGSVTSALDLSGQKLGSAALSENIRVYECVGDSKAVRISLDDLMQSRVDPSHILFASYDYAGRVDLLYLDDVTGDRYTYGFYYQYTAGNMGSLDPDNKPYSATVTMETMGGIYGPFDCADTFEVGDPGGIVASPDGKLASSISLTAVRNIARSDFETASDGTVTVTAGGMTFRVADNVPCYLRGTDSWGNLARARAFSSSFTVYYDRAPSSGGKIRLIVAE